MASYIHYRTNREPWQPDPGIPGFLVKRMFTDPVTGQFTEIHYVPPGWGDEVTDGQPYRHYHRSVYERALCLFGDFPHWEFREPADTQGELKALRTGIFMDRPPMTIHGLFPQPKSIAGAATLAWNTGGGTSVEDPRAKDETIPIPFDDYHGINLAFTSPRFTHLTDMPWVAHPSVPGWKQKLLGARNTLAPEALLVSIPPDWRPGSTHGLARGADRKWIFLMSGDLSLDMTEKGQTQRLVLAEHDYVDWLAPALPSFGTDGPVTTGGAVVLCVAHDLSPAR
jgi:hypothetical protein